MKLMFAWLLKKTGVYNYVWGEFCKEYPVRISGATPEARKYLEDHQRVVQDMMLYGMGCTHYIDPRSISVPKDTVLH